MSILARVNDQIAVFGLKRLPGYKLLAQAGQLHHALIYCRPAFADPFCAQPRHCPDWDGDSKEEKAKNGFRRPAGPARRLVHSQKYGGNHNQVCKDAN